MTSHHSSLICHSLVACNQMTVCCFHASYIIYFTNNATQNENNTHLNECIDELMSSYNSHTFEIKQRERKKKRMNHFNHLKSDSFSHIIAIEFEKLDCSQMKSLFICDVLRKCRRAIFHFYHSIKTYWSL